MGLLMDEKEFGMLEEKQQKKYLFKENVRLNELKQELEADRELIDIQKGMLHRQQKKNQLLQKQLENQKIFFDQKWEILERETRQLALDKEKFNREKLMYRDKVYREARRSMSNAENVKIFFRGVNDTESVKKRYRALLKIYHPDNMNGDNDLVLAILLNLTYTNDIYMRTKKSLGSALRGFCMLSKGYDRSFIDK